MNSSKHHAANHYTCPGLTGLSILKSCPAAEIAHSSEDPWVLSPKKPRCHGIFVEHSWTPLWTSLKNAGRASWLNHAEPIGPQVTRFGDVLSHEFINLNPRGMTCRFPSFFFNDVDLTLGSLKKPSNHPLVIRDVQLQAIVALLNFGRGDDIHHEVAGLASWVVLHTLTLQVEEALSHASLETRGRPFHHAARAMLRFHRFREAVTILAAGAVDTAEELGDGGRRTVQREHQPLFPLGALHGRQRDLLQRLGADRRGLGEELVAVQPLMAPSRHH
mmetsp:Transcript_2423/g.4155  ORF Transcript_2423/g.4155 Transcript_2423/m.4155 type:complete len:275 (+) Transcript_2423:98-922(+)